MKKFIAITLLVLIIFALPVCAGAEESYIFDEAGVLTDDQISELEAAALELSEQYECGLYIAVVDIFADDSIFNIATNFYTEYGLGYGDAKDGALLFMNMYDRDYSLIAYGPFGNAAFTDFGKNVLSEEFLDDFSSDDWYAGFSDYLTKSGEMLEQARDGNPLDTVVALGDSAVSDSQPVGFFEAFISSLGVSLIVGFILSAITCLIILKLNKSVYAGTNAQDYVNDESLSITKKDDRYSHSTVVRTKIENDSKSGGTSVNSSGFSGKSGKF